MSLEIAKNDQNDTLLESSVISGKLASIRHVFWQKSVKLRTSYQKPFSSQSHRYVYNEQ